MSPAGMGPAGLDPVMPLPPIPAPTSPNLPGQAPVALRFDGATQDYLLDANGYYLGIDPVDQMVALALIPRQGTLGSVPELGATFWKIKRLGPSTVTDATNAANAALASLVQSGQIAVLSIQVQVVRKPGRLLIAVTYKNLTKRPVPTTGQTLSFQINLGGG